jgi:alcohol dehydrogenase (cytochrome c)
MSSLRKRLLWSSGIALGLAVAALEVDARVRWRTEVLALYAARQIPDIELNELLTYLRPGADQALTRLVETRNPYAVIRNPHVSVADIERGRTLFRSNACVSCHGDGGNGGPAGVALVGRRFTHGESDWALYRTIRHGAPRTAMPAHALNDGQLWQLVTYVRSLEAGGRHVAGGDAAPRDVRLPYAELQATREPGAEWLTYSGSYASTRHSTLTKIDAGNVRRLALRWMYQFPGLSGPSGSMEVSPIVRNGVMFVTTPPSRVVAIDAATGTRLWSFDHQLPDDRGGEFGSHVNRGVALLDDKVFVGTLDGHVIALKAATGEQVWETPVSRDLDMYFISSAPLAYRDLVVIGVGTRGGGRGFIVALDAKTGAERWRFVAIPDPGQPGHDTWDGESWRNGGAPTWLTGSYDPDADVLIWATGNPKPDYENDRRRGDNLYSNSALALRGSTGKLLWHFQFTPADDHDWDANQMPVLVDRGADKQVLWANRNGFFYVLDRQCGAFIRATPFVHQTWSEGIDSTGRPILTDVSRTKEGAVLYPGNGGATNWWAPSYDPQLDLMFVPTLEQGMVYFSSSSSYPDASGKPLYTAVRALDAKTGALVWERRNAVRLRNPHTGGVLTTRSGLLFGGDETTLFALRSATGEQLWSVQTGGGIVAAPVTYLVNGEQFVTIAAGSTIMTFAIP